MFISDSFREDAGHTAPENARTVFIPTVRRRVVLPDIFDPVIIAQPFSREKSLRTSVFSEISGWPIPFASKKGVSDSSISAKAPSGYIVDTEARLISASHSPIAISLSGIVLPDLCLHFSRSDRRISSKGIIIFRIKYSNGCILAWIKRQILYRAYS